MKTVRKLKGWLCDETAQNDEVGAYFIIAFGVLAAITFFLQYGLPFLKSLFS